MAKGLHVQATAWGPRSLSLRNSHPLSRSQDNRLSGSVTLSGKETEAFAGSSPCCMPEPLGHSYRGAPAPPHPVPSTHADTQTGLPAHLLLDFLQLQHQLIYLMPGVHKLLCLLLPGGDSERVW